MQRYLVDEDQKAVLQLESNLPVATKSQVVVAGGGISGLVAAVAAAREGMDVVLVEGNSFLGGTATASMMGAFVGSGWTAGISKEILDRLANMSAAPKWDNAPGRSGTTPFDTEALKSLALDMAQESGVRLLLYSHVTDVIVENGIVKGIITESKSGRQAILCDVAIDCTGDADIAIAAGAPYMKGREIDGKMRPMAFIFRVGNIDFDKLLKYAEENPDQMQSQHRKGTLLWAGNERVVTRISGFYELVDVARKRGEVDEHCYYFRLENCWIERGTAIVNTTRIYGVDGTKVEDLTSAELEGRKQASQLISFMKKHIPGCESIYLQETAVKLGVRETRRIHGEYSLTDDDIYADKTFDDAIMRMSGSLPVRPAPLSADVHGPDPGEGSINDPIERNPGLVKRERHAYEIPYRCLIPKGIDNILVAGRSIAVSHLVDNSTRNMLVCMRMGQVAGTAAALAVKTAAMPREINIPDLKQKLLEAGLLS
ncbi:FAD-dependent oxidoreductase [Candidatus Poribacteria bacterium]